MTQPEMLTQESKPKRHWLQLLLGLPVIFLSLIAFISAKPKVNFDNSSQVDILYNLTGLLGSYFPAILLLIIALLILRKPKIKKVIEK
jgi:hypothetical protein